MAVSGCVVDVRLIVYFERNVHLAYDHCRFFVPEPLICSQEAALTQLGEAQGYSASGNMAFLARDFSSNWWSWCHGRFSWLGELSVEPPSNWELVCWFWSSVPASPFAGTSNQKQATTQKGTLYFEIRMGKILFSFYQDYAFIEKGRFVRLNCSVAGECWDSNTGLHMS